MERVIDLENVSRALDIISQTEYEVAIKREEDLWYTHRNMRDRIEFLHTIGVTDYSERDKMLAWAEGEYRKYTSKQEWARVEKELDVGF